MQKKLPWVFGVDCLASMFVCFFFLTRKGNPLLVFKFISVSQEQPLTCNKREFPKKEWTLCFIFRDNVYLSMFMIFITAFDLSLLSIRQEFSFDGIHIRCVILIFAITIFFAFHQYYLLWNTSLLHSSLFAIRWNFVTDDIHTFFFY